jgi:rhodanese-related sulfurtransferase
MKKHILTIVLSIIFGILIISMIGKKMLTSSYNVSAQEQARVLTAGTSSFSLFDLSMAIKENSAKILLVDIRAEVEYTKGHLPNAINIPLEGLLKADLNEFVGSDHDKVLVFYGNSESDAVRAISVLLVEGKDNVKALNGNYLLAKQYVIDNPSPSYYHFSDEKMQYNYGRLMPAGSNTTPTKAEPVNIQPTTPRGGC